MMQVVSCLHGDTSKYMDISYFAVRIRRILDEMFDHITAFILSELLMPDFS